MSTRASLGFEARLSAPFEEVVERVTEALKERGFGILTRIDLKEAFAEKIGVDFRRYLILGACNPGLAHMAVTAHPEVGLLLPCNVTVEEGENGEVIVRLTDPAQLFGSTGLDADPEMQAVIDQASESLSTVAASL